MTDQLVALERFGLDGNVVQIVLGEGSELPSNISRIQKTFSDCFERDEFEIILNMAKVKYPSSTFIALLIEATNVARRFGGDIKIINLPLTAKSNFVSFSAKTYMSIAQSEEYAFYDFGDESVVLPQTFQVPESNSQDETDATDVTEAIISKPEQPEKAFDFSQSQHMKSDRIRVSSEVKNLYMICDFVIKYARTIGFNERECGKIKVTIYEACLNVIEHAYFSDPNNWIEVTVFYDDEKLITVIHDWGEGFEYEPHKDYDVEQAMNDRKTGGFGMYIIERTVDELKYEASDELGNRLYLLKYVPDKKTDPDDEGELSRE